VMIVGQHSARLSFPGRTLAVAALPVQRHCVNPTVFVYVGAAGTPRLLLWPK
jgi:hypothetical protein